MLGEEIKEIIMGSPSKFCKLDSIPTALLKRLLPVVLPDITSLVNLSLRTGTFADEWKIACVKPLIKSINMELIKNSYRPISNCNFILKIVEKSMLVQLNQHCNLHGLLPSYQSAYQAFHPCETSLLKLCNDMLWQMEYQEVSSLIVCNLSAAFDTINHQTLIEVLSEYYGVRGTVLKWFESYLENCKFYISIDENKSTSRDLHFSVPQGSCAAPLLFGIYCSTLQETIPKEGGPDSYQSNGTRKQRAWCAPSVDSTLLYGFADDHSLNKGFRPDHVEEVSTISELEGTLANINSWMGENWLKMNNSKTEFPYVASHHQLQKCKSKGISVCGENVPRSDFIRLLGAWIDKTLNMKQHITVKCKIAMWNVQKIKHIRKYLTQEVAQLLASSIVMSHLDYANSLLYGLSKM